MLDFYNDYSKRLQLEKLVIGLEEPIFIKGIGEFMAKIDSGNGGFNVIHGEDVYQNGGVIVFKTFTSDGELKNVSKKLLQYINVNIGSGKVEQRPVIELDIKFGEENYKKIPFSVADRSSNSHKVLICKDFIQNELDALIDVSGKGLSQRGVEVEYINEAWSWNKDVEQTKQDAQNGPLHRKIPANIGLGVGSAAKGIAGGLAKGTKNVLKMPFQGIAKDIKKKGGVVRSFLRAMQGAGKFTDAEMLGAGEEAKKAGNYDDYFEEDKKLIMRKTAQSINNLLIYKMIDYQGKYYKSKTVTKAEEQNFLAFVEGNKILAEADPKKMEQYQKQQEKEQNQQQQQDKTNNQQDQQAVQQATSQTTQTALPAQQPATNTEDTTNLQNTNASFVHKPGNLLLEVPTPADQAYVRRSWYRLRTTSKPRSRTKRTR